MKTHEEHEIRIIFEVFEKLKAYKKMRYFIKKGYKIIDRHLTNKKDDMCYYILYKSDRI